MAEPRYYEWRGPDGTRYSRESDIPLTQEEKATVGEQLGGPGTQFVRELGGEPQGALMRAARALRPIRRGYSETVVPAIRQALGTEAIPEGIRLPMSPMAQLFEWLAPKTEEQLIAGAVAPVGGRLGARLLPRVPRLGATAGQIVGGGGAAGATAAVTGRDIKEEATGGGMMGLIGSLLGQGKGILSRQLPGGEIRAGREMAPELGRFMGQVVPTLRGAETPQALFEAASGMAGRRPLIQQKLSQMMGQEVSRVETAVGPQKLFIPSLMHPQDVTDYTTLMAQATRPATMPQSVRLAAQARRDADALLQRSGITWKEVQIELRAGSQAWRSPSQAVGTQEARAFVGEILNELDTELTRLAVPPGVLARYAWARGQYKRGEAFLELLGPKGAFTATREMLPSQLQEQMKTLTKESPWSLPQRLGMDPTGYSKTHAKLSDILHRGAPHGTRDVPGFLPALAHLVIGSEGRPKGYTSWGGRTPLISKYTAAPGRLPLESSQAWKDLMAVLAQTTRGAETESPAVK